MSSKRRDWFHILRNLKAGGISYREVARKTGRSVYAVVNWAEGGEPKDSDAQVVLALYAKHCPVEYEAHMNTRGLAERISAVTTPGETQALPFVG